MSYYDDLKLVMGVIVGAFVAMARRCCCTVSRHDSSSGGGSGGGIIFDNGCNDDGTSY
jgi:hypothetical protein